RGGKIEDKTRLPLLDQFLPLLNRVDLDYLDPGLLDRSQDRTRRFHDVDLLILLLSNRSKNQPEDTHQAEDDNDWTEDRGEAHALVAEHLPDFFSCHLQDRVQAVTFS